jgi:hypothetical protein
MSLFIRLTLALAAIIIGFVVLAFVVKVLIVAAVLAAVAFAVIVAATAFRRRFGRAPGTQVMTLTARR